LRMIPYKQWLVDKEIKNKVLSFKFFCPESAKKL